MEKIRSRRIFGGKRRKKEDKEGQRREKWDSF